MEDRGTKTPANDLCKAVILQCQKNGLLVQSRGSHGRLNVVRLVPPMVSTDTEIDRGMDILQNALRSCLRGHQVKAA